VYSYSERHQASDMPFYSFMLDSVMMQ